MLLAWQCIDPPLAPVAPTTDVQLSIPLFDRTRTVFDFSTKDTNALKRSSDGGYFFETTESSPPVGIDTLKVTPRSSAQQVSLGKFGVDALPMQTFSFQAGFPDATVPNGVPFPASSFRVDSLSLNISSQFDYVAIDTGSLTLTLTNNLPLNITIQNPILLRNNITSPPSQVDTSVVGSFDFGTVDSGRTKSVTSSLSRKFLRGFVKTDSIRINTAARTGPFTISSGDGVSFSVSSTPILADSASAIIPSQSITSTNDSIIVIDDSVSIQNATFRSGAITCALINNLGITVGVFLKFDNFVNTSTNSVFLIQQNIPPRDSFIVPINMANMIIDTTNATPPIGTNVRFSVGISTINSGNQKSVVTKNDFVRAELRAAQPLVVRSITGRIKPTTVLINSGMSGPLKGEILAKFKADSVAFDSVKLALNLGLTGGFPTDYNLRVVAMKFSTGQTDSLFVPPASTAQPSARGTIYPGINQSTQIVLDNSTGLSDFLAKLVPNLPDSFIVRGDVTINPPAIFPTVQGLQKINDTSKVYTSLNTYFPLKIGLANAFLVDSVDLDNKQTFDKGFVTSVKKGTMYLQFTNGLPVQLTFHGALLGKLTPTSPRDTLLRIPTTGPQIIQAATVNADGTVKDPTISTVTISLVGNDIDMFNFSDAMWMRFDVVTTPGPKTVKIRQQDFIKIRASANMVYQVNKP